MKRVLFVSENVTLAQVVRLVTLAKALDTRRYEIHFACSEFDDLVFADTSFTRHALYTLPRERVDRALASGKRLYEKRDLRAYLDADLGVIDRVRPSLIVGDFRLSLCVAAPLRGIPHAALINAYWSPDAERDGFPLPEHPIVDLLGVDLATRYFPRAVPAVFAHFAKPVNELRRERGLAPLGSLAKVVTHGDWVLYPDVPEIVPVRTLRPGHLYLGHVPWSPAVAPPSLDGLDPSRPLVYVTLGSSGKWERLSLVLGALAKLPVAVLVSTAGRSVSVPRSPNARIARFVPGDWAAERASLVICNGGASTAYQALGAGRPVIGIPHNLDQYFAMTAIAKTGAGVLLRSGTLDESDLSSAVTRLLGSPEPRANAERVATAMSRYDARARFAAFVDSASSARRSA